ncbi:CRISPR-associated protein Cas2 [Desulfarculus baarsii DSM 2075]|uniref:CRISPR-associated endoribonuclease Cas2 n=1 Tax=Desulfarculus baarsii (strain ATCC 33931 / DSM 2075 / LMG 7858 / VKM B-1802 / 2st14) TaxID=644282 RepID=E1QHL7_DESB2|nr:CRISPR-associated endonuclease Cas2 [Desulfarculus baarsii]ADK85060.1 CRISPR-associated protein Cas2 [Desulfarculus baarsii DSM 2075]
MSGAEMLVVFAYDVEDDSRRRRLARVLGNHAVRVQKSVFEAWLDEGAAKIIASRAAAELGPRDSLRVYALDASGVGKTLVFGVTAPPQSHDYYFV